MVRQSGCLVYSDEDFLSLAPSQYEELVNSLEDFSVEDQSAFLQPNEATHFRVAGYHARIAASHRAFASGL